MNAKEKPERPHVYLNSNKVWMEGDKPIGKPITPKPSHTATPWKVMSEKDDSSPDPENPNGYYIAYDESQEITDLEICKGLDQANAEHIVKCVNSHDALVGALKAIKKRLKDLSADPRDYKLNRIREKAHEPYYKTIDDALKQAGEAE